VLQSLKPGTGFVDAPKAFHIKLARVILKELGFVPSRTDEELLILYISGTLAALICIHVDDLKITAVPALIHKIVATLERTFGKLIVQWNKFTNCGVRHIQCPTTFAVTLDQIEYIMALKQMPMKTQDGVLIGRRGTPESIDIRTFEVFRSLRGAVAYCLLTRGDVSVYIVALQRCQEADTTWQHVKILNQVVRRLQGKPVVLRYEYLGPETCFLVFTDAAFKKEESTGHALKGTAVVRVKHPGSLSGNVLPIGRDHPCHLVDYLTKRVRNVTRSTFSAELFSLCDACDHAMMLRVIVHEFQCHILSAAQGRDLREGALKSPVSLGILVDAMSVYAAITANHIKIPAEKGLLSHLQYVRELLDRGILKFLAWTDTRDMLADAVTKGGLDRDRIELAMAGRLRFDRDQKVWQAKVLKSIANGSSE
jgi:hypothetical protein